VDPASSSRFRVPLQVEGAFKIASGQLRVLSEQQLLDCSNQGGCLGGETPSGLIYVELNKGVDTEKEYSWMEGTLPSPPPKFPCWKQAAARHAATIFNHTFGARACRHHSACCRNRRAPGCGPMPEISVPARGAGW
jgi:hypothetical protein